MEQEILKRLCEAVEQLAKDVQAIKERYAPELAQASDFDAIVKR